MKTIEKKAKAYDEIIERAKTMLAAGEVMYGKENNASQLITDIIPELRESEDERIRKKCIAIISKWTTKEDRDECIAYLEKQKEQKPNPLCGSTEEYYREAYYADQPQKEQKPAEWSEEDKQCLDETIKLLENLGYDGDADNLKRLRPSWKPTSDQIALVTRVCNNLHIKNSDDAAEMDKLSKQLGDLYWKGSVESWKPSEEDMNTIGLAIQVLNSSGHNSLCCKLNALRDDLLKLK